MHFALMNSIHVAKKTWETIRTLVARRAVILEYDIKNTCPLFSLLPI